jgi:hypothetical protein
MVGLVTRTLPLFAGQRNHLTGSHLSSPNGIASHLTMEVTQ